MKIVDLIGAIIAIEILLDVLELLNVIHVENGVDTIYSFWQMLSWIFIVGYCIWDYYGYFYLCNDTMLLLSPRSKYEILKQNKELINKNNENELKATIEK